MSTLETRTIPFCYKINYKNLPKLLILQVSLQFRGRLPS